MRSFFAALGFLTAVPVPRSVREDLRLLGRAVLWFPAVGLLAGGGLAALDGALSLLFPPAVRAALVVLSWIVLSRGLHLDGLADAADGLAGVRPPERAMEIMRDPRSGPMGVAAVAGVLSLKMAALYSLPGDLRWRALLLAPLAGRCALGAVMGFWPYARPTGGLASALKDGSGRGPAAVSAILFIAVSPLLLGWAGWGTAAAAVFAAWTFAAWVNRRIGGYTGDTLGAACELTETVVLLSVSAAAYLARVNI